MAAKYYPIRTTRLEATMGKLELVTSSHSILQQFLLLLNLLDPIQFASSCILIILHSSSTTVLLGPVRFRCLPFPQCKRPYHPTTFSPILQDYSTKKKKSYAETDTKYFRFFVNFSLSLVFSGNFIPLIWATRTAVMSTGSFSL